MAITKEVLDELLKEYKGPEDLTGPEGLLKQLTKALIERAMDAEITTHLGYEKHDQSEKDTTNRRNVYRAHGQKLPEVCALQGPQSRSSRSEGSICFAL